MLKISGEFSRSWLKRCFLWVLFWGLILIN